jgi:protein-disulfide isomerase
MENKETNVNEWVEERLASLDAPGTWRPDAVRARKRLGGRACALRWRRWMGASATAAAVVLGIVVLGAPRACATPRGCAASLWQRVFATEIAAHRVASGPLTATFKESGAPTAPITCEIYSDYQCPFCAQMFTQTVPALSEYVKAGKVRLVHRDFPLSQHQYARLAARYANAAGLLGYYDAVVDRIFRTQKIWSQDGDIAAQLTQVLRPDALQKVREMADSDVELDQIVAADMELAAKEQIRETPTLVIVSRGQRQTIAGVPDISLLKRYLNELLADGK